MALWHSRDNCCLNSEFYLTDGTNDALKVVKAMVELTGKDITCNTQYKALSIRKQAEEYTRGRTRQVFEFWHI